jgi:hypothetical protein
VSTAVDRFYALFETAARNELAAAGCDAGRPVCADDRTATSRRRIPGRRKDGVV